jgi:two-component system sensor histidine kinase BaeS
MFPQCAGKIRRPPEVDQPMFNTLRAKLFFSLLLLNTVMACLVYYGSSELFQRGFKTYIRARVMESMSPVTDSLAAEFQKTGSWSALVATPARWEEIIRTATPLPMRARGGDMIVGEASPAGLAPGPMVGDAVIGFGGSAPLPGDPQPRLILRKDGVDLPPGAPFPPASTATPGTSPPSFAQRGPDPRNRFPAPPIERMLLLDDQQRILIGAREEGSDLVERPIVVEGRTVGYFGIEGPKEFLEGLDRGLIIQLTRSFGLIAAGMLFATIVAVALVAWFTTRPLRALTQGADALGHGDYDVTVSVKGNDELGVLARSFNSLATALREARQARRRQIADLAHELRTPISVLRGELEALEDGIRPLDRKSVQSLTLEMTRLTRLVDDLQLLSLSDANALLLHFGDVDLAEAVQDSIAASKGALSKGRLEVSVEVANTAVVRADEQRLGQLLANLMQNSLRYTDPDGRVRIAIARHGATAELVWEDSAPAVADHELVRLSDRLFRVDGSRSRASGGAGLGLSIARAIVEAHGGRMQASRSPLGGLRWTIELPIAEGA